MKAAILARGLATRMRAAAEAPLDAAQAAAATAGLKSLMPIRGRPFLDYALSRLADAGARDVALVIGPDQDDPVRARYDRTTPPARVRVTFVVQSSPRGTADAVLACENWAGSSAFLVVNADNLYPVETLRALIALDGPGLPAFASDDLVRTSNIPPDRVAAFALLEIDAQGRLTRIAEKPGPAAVEAAGPQAKVSMNCWRFDARIFDACRDITPSVRGELELPTAVSLAMSRGVPFQAVPAHGPVLDLSGRADVAEVERLLDGEAPRP